MPRFEKWLADVRPDASPARVARHALKVRLQAVEHYLKDAAEVTGERERDADAVHQLRIWTRRSAAALRLFAEVLPRRTTKWVKRRLRKIRRTAGQARDCDVMAARLEKGEIPGLEASAVHLHARRSDAERKLAKLAKQLLKSGKWEQKTKKLLAKIRWRGDKSATADAKRGPEFGPWCRERLQPLRDAFFQMAAGKLTSGDALHELRIAGKRLRYGLELAVVAIPSKTHQRLYEGLNEIQDRLGEVCDKLASVARFQLWLGETRSAAARKPLQAALRHERKQLAASKARFSKWWTARRRQELVKIWQRALK